MTTPICTVCCKHSMTPSPNGNVVFSCMLLKGKLFGLHSFDRRSFHILYFSNSSNTTQWNLHFKLKTFIKRFTINLYIYIYIYIYTYIYKWYTIISSIIYNTNQALSQHTLERGVGWSVWTTWPSKLQFFRGTLLTVLWHFSIILMSYGPCLYNKDK